MVVQPRFHALDCARAFALLAGIVLHATTSFFDSYPVADSSPSTTLGVTFYVIHIFRMSMFFLIAGFFAHLVLHRRGPLAFVRDRSKRILVPLVAGWLIFGTSSIAIDRTFGGGYFSDGSFPFVHLWFLYYLLIFYVIALTVRAIFDGLIDRSGQIRVGIDAVVRGVTSMYIAPIVLATPLLILQYFYGAWFGWEYGSTPDMGFRPQLFAMVGYGSAFGFGWFLHRQAKLLDCFRATWHVHLGIAILLTAVCLMIPGRAVSGAAWSRIAYGCCYTAAMGFWTFGLIGVALRFFSQESRVVRYLADSSYWLYLAHLPLVWLLLILFAELPLHWTVKFPLILAIALTVLLVSYHYWIRPTWVGALLNGRKYPRRRITRAHSGRPAASEAPRTLEEPPLTPSVVGRRHSLTTGFVTGADDAGARH